MTRRPADRGVSEVMGFILIFGMVVVAFTVYQGVVVPDQNRQVEFQHNTAVQGQLQELRNAIVNTATTGTGQSVSVTLGATYPRRTLAINLGVSAGAIATDPAATGIRLDNVRAVDPETRDHVDTAANGPLGPIRSKAIRYTPVYSFYTSAPRTVYENTLAYNRFDDVNLTLTGQLLVDDRRITLVAVNGSVSTARRETVSISTEAISPATNRIAVRNTTGDRVTVTVPTGLSATAWESLLAEELVANGGYVEAVVDAPGVDAVTLVMRPGVVYELGMAKVGVGDATVGEPPRYATTVAGDEVSVPEGGSQQLVVEVRDRFNNPVSNVTVSADQPTVGTVSPASARTDVEGRAALQYLAPDDVGGAREVDVVASFEGDGSARERVTFDLTVLDADGSGGGGTGDSLNPSGAGSVVLKDAVIGGGSCANATCVSITFENTADETQTLTAMRFVFYGVDSQSANTPDPPGSARQDGHLLVNGGPYNDDVDVEIGPNVEGSMPLSLYETDAGETSYDDVGEGDFLVLAVIIDDGAGSATYFVAPRA